MLWPAIAAKLGLGEARAERRDVVAEGLAALKESNEALALNELRKLTEPSPSIAGDACSTCASEDCQGGPDCNYRARLRLGISEQWARKLRRDEWTALIARREARRAA